MMKDPMKTTIPSGLSAGFARNFFVRHSGVLLTVAALLITGCTAPRTSIPPVVGPGAADPPLEGTVFLRNDMFRVAVNTNDLRMTAMFLDSGRSWVAPSPVEMENSGWRAGAVQAVRLVDARNLEVDVEWSLPLTISYSLAEQGAQIDISILPGAPAGSDAPSVDRLLFPMTPVELGPVSPLLQEAILPYGSGMLLPLSAVELEPYLLAGLPESHLITEQGWNLPFFGISSDPHGSSCMIAFLTPTDAGIQWVPREITLPGQSGPVTALLPTPFHAPSKRRFDRPVEVRMNFFESGGFLAMAERYRADLQAAGTWKDWKTKASDAVGILRFDPLVAIWDEETDAASVWNPEKYNLLDIDFAWIRSKPWAPAQTQVPSMLSWPKWPGLFSPAEDCRIVEQTYDSDRPLQQLRVDQSGSPMVDPPVYSPTAIREELLQLISDVTKNPQVRGLAIPDLTRDLEEDWNPLHPATRATDLEARRELLDMISLEAGLPIAADGGPWWAEPYQDLATGALSIRPMWTAFCKKHNLANPNAGNDLNPLEVRTFWDLAWNPTTRIPLWQSVFHDATIATAEPYQDPARFPAQWARYDLFMLLYSAPACWWAPNPENEEDPKGPSPRHWEDIIEIGGEWVPGMEAVTYGERKERELQILAPWRTVWSRRSPIPSVTR
jgi:hypothetical protein